MNLAFGKKTLSIELWYITRSQHCSFSLSCYCLQYFFHFCAVAVTITVSLAERNGDSNKKWICMSLGITFVVILWTIFTFYINRISKIKKKSVNENCRDHWFSTKVEKKLWQNFQTLKTKKSIQKLNLFEIQLHRYS